MTFVKNTLQSPPLKPPNFFPIFDPVFLLHHMARFQFPFYFPRSVFVLCNINGENIIYSFSLIVNTNFKLPYYGYLHIFVLANFSIRAELIQCKKKSGVRSAYNYNYNSSITRCSLLWSQLLSSPLLGSSSCCCCCNSSAVAAGCDDVVSTPAFPAIRLQV